MLSGISCSFNAEFAKEIGIHAAIIFNIIKSTPCNFLSIEYLYACVGSFMTMDEIRGALTKLKNSNFIQDDIRFSISNDGEKDE